MADNEISDIDIKYRAQKRNAMIVYTVMFVILGVFISWQVYTANEIRKNEVRESESRLASYENRVAQLEEELAVLNGEIADLNEEYDARLDSLASKDNDFFRVVEFYNSSIDKYSLYAGTSDVFGNGIEISIDDANSFSGEVNQFMLVHDSTLLSIVNTLRDAGAQAISINGERIVSDSEILCVGTSIRVNEKFWYFRRNQ